MAFLVYDYSFVCFFFLPSAPLSLLLSLLPLFLLLLPFPFPFFVYSQSALVGELKAWMSACFFSLQAVAFYENMTDLNLSFREFTAACLKQTGSFLKHLLQN